MREAASATGVCFLDSQAPVAGSIDHPGPGRLFHDSATASSMRGRARRGDLPRPLVEAVKGIAIHEIGHSLGLLHQFASS